MPHLRQPLEASLLIRPLHALPQRQHKGGQPVCTGAMTQLQWRRWHLLVYGEGSTCHVCVDRGVEPCRAQRSCSTVATAAGAANLCDLPQRGSPRSGK